MGTLWYCSRARQNIHADPNDGVICQTINEYLAENNVDCICILRPQDCNGKDAASFAIDCANKKIPFNNSFNYKCGCGMYCTELVLLAWENAGVVILPTAKRGSRIKPSCLLSTDRLYCVRKIVEGY